MEYNKEDIDKMWDKLHERQRKLENKVTDIYIKSVDKLNLKLDGIAKDILKNEESFKVGDLVRNKCGKIIKVDEITYKMYYTGPKIVYSGLTYKKKQGVYCRTKNNDTQELFNVTKCN